MILTPIIRWKHDLDNYEIWLKLDGAGEDDVKSYQDEWWSKARCLFGTGEVDIGSIHDKLWHKQGDFLGQE